MPAGSWPPRSDRPGMSQGLPALVATDLDGTLLHTDGTASSYTTDVLRLVEGAGVHVVVVAARPPMWLGDFAHVVGRHGHAICANGAFVYDVRGRRMVAEPHAGANAGARGREPGFVNPRPVPAARSVPWRTCWSRCPESFSRDTWTWLPARSWRPWTGSPPSG